MTREPDSSSDGQPAPSRRQVLRRTGAALGAGAAATATAGAQQNDTAGGPETETETGAPGPEGDGDPLVNGVIIEQPEYDQPITGFWIHLAEEIDPRVASVDDECDYVSWANDEQRAYDALLIDRTADPQQQPITLYLHERVDVMSGGLYIVNTVHPCQSGYLGVELERVGADLVTLWADDLGTATPREEGGGGGVDPGTPETGPGFGLLGGVAGLAGLGWLLRDGDGGDE